jgi:hypothetical protein
VADWIAGLPEAEKTTLLVRLVVADERWLRAELLGRFPASHPSLARDVARCAGRQEDARARLARLGERHAKKSTFIARLQAAGLIG